ncbi:MAG: hypothetical protein ACLS4A_08970 [Oscillospiraceae bacterium]
MKSLPMTFFEYISGKGECQRRKPDRQEKRMTFSAVKSGAFSGFMTETVYNTGRKEKGKLFGKTNCNKNVIFFKKGVAICKHLCYNMATYIRAKE